MALLEAWCKVELSPELHPFCEGQWDHPAGNTSSVLGLNSQGWTKGLAS